MINSKELILAGIALLAGVLLDLMWMYGVTLARRHSALPREQLPGADAKPSRIRAALAGWFAQASFLPRLKGTFRFWLTLAGLILLAGLVFFPSIIVMLDRWFNWPGAIYLLSNDRCRVIFFCSINLPAYFILIIVCLAAAGLLIAFFPVRDRGFIDAHSEPPAPENVPSFQKRIGRLLRWIALTEFIVVAGLSIVSRVLPGAGLGLVAALFVAGWLMSEFSLARGWKVLEENRDWLFASALAHVALLAVITAYYVSPSSLAICAVGLLLAALLLIRSWRRVPMIYWIFSLGLILFSTDINAWWTSVVGDEYGFYETARAVAANPNILQVASRLFDERGVYGVNPYSASIVQGVFLRLFGPEGFGWRFSNIYLAALAIPLLYLFLKRFLDRRVALLACFFLAVSHYLINFSKIGYVNLQALFLFCLTLAAAAWAARSGRTAAFATAGVVMGMNFYVYGIAVVAIPMALLLLILFAPPRSRSGLLRWAVLACGFGILFFPLLFQPIFWKTGLGLTVFGGGNGSPSPVGPLQLAVNRIVVTWFSYLYSPNETHFVAVSFVDGITAAFVGVGVFAILYQTRKNRFAVFFLLGLCGLLTIAGILGSPDLPGTTRMFILLPWWAAAAAYGVWWFRDKLLSLGGPESKIHAVWIGGFLAVVAGLNLISAKIISFDRFQDLQSFEALVERVAEQSQSRPAESPQQFLFLTSSEYSLYPFEIFREVYPRYWIDLPFQKVSVTGPSLLDTAMPIILNPDAVVFVQPNLAKEWQEAIRTALVGLGEEYCPVITPSGKWELDMYVPPRLDWVCTRWY